MAIPVLAPLSTSVTLLAPLPIPTSDETKVPAAPDGTGVSETSSRNTDLPVLLSVRLNPSVEVLPVAVTRTVCSMYPWFARMLVSASTCAPFHDAVRLLEPLVFDAATQKSRMYC